MSVAPQGTPARADALPTHAATPARPAPPPWTVPLPDLVDRLDLSGVSEQARGELRALSVDLASVYHRSDATAQRRARHHQLIVLFVGGFGTLAILLAIAELAANFKSPSFHLGVVEPLAAAIAVLAVLLGIVAARQQSWLNQRHRAERCQFLFWQVLTDSALWSSDESDIARLIGAARAELQVIERVRYEQLAAWSEDEELTETVPTAPSRPTRSLGNLYAQIRLRGQLLYFEARSAQNHVLDSRTRRMTIGAFFGSVLAALGHFVSDWWDGPDWLSFWLLFAAAAIPALGGGIRLMRGALEPARNFARYRGKHLFLEHRLVEVEEIGDAPGPLLRKLAAIERSLRAEHREWLRLMMEAEWIG